MTEAQLEEIRVRCDAATPGPWRFVIHCENYGQGYGATTFFVQQGDELLKIGMAEGSQDALKMRNDTQFIAHAREDISLLLYEIERLKGGH